MEYTGVDHSDELELRFAAIKIKENDSCCFFKQKDGCLFAKKIVNIAHLQN